MKNYAGELKYKMSTIKTFAFLIMLQQACLFLIEASTNNTQAFCAHPFYPCFYLDCSNRYNHEYHNFTLYECAKNEIYDEIKQLCVEAHTWSHCHDDFTKHLNLETIGIPKVTTEILTDFSISNLMSKLELDHTGARMKRSFQMNRSTGLLDTKTYNYLYQLIMGLGQTWLPSVRNSSINSYNTEINDVNLTLLSNNKANLNFKLKNLHFDMLNGRNATSHLNTNEENLNITIEFDSNATVTEARNSLMTNKTFNEFLMTIPVAIGNRIENISVNINKSKLVNGRLMLQQADMDMVENIKRIENMFRYKKVCYFTNWSQYRPNPGYFTPDHVDPHLCTHIIYAFAYIDNITLTLRTIEQNDLDFYKRINNLKLKNPKLKTMLGVGGWNHPSKEFSDMVSDERSQMVFIYHAMKFVRHYGFDGVDIDWEYPGDRGGLPQDKEKFTLFLKDFRHAIDNETLQEGREKLILSAAVAAGKSRIEKAYEIPKLASSLDFINLMTFDFHGSWDNKTGLNAPLYTSDDEDTTVNSEFSQDWAVNYWLANGFPPHKIVLGLPGYGRTFTLANENNTLLGAHTIGEGMPGDYTKTPGFLSFYECCVLHKTNKWKLEWHNKSKSYSMHYGNQWISFDDVKSFHLRTAYVVAKRLGGMFVFAIDMDDFTGEFCDLGTYPLLKNSLSLLMEYMPEYYASITKLRAKQEQLKFNIEENQTQNTNATTTTAVPTKTPSITETPSTEPYKRTDLLQILQEKSKSSSKLSYSKLNRSIGRNKIK